MDEFTGKGTPLSNDGLAEACDTLHVGLPEIWAILKVETSGCGFLPDRRPQILFERHVFHRQTLGRFDHTAPDLSDDDAGGYEGGAREYARLTRAIALDRQTALNSASWGIGQIMGENAGLVGFPDVETMVRTMVESEDAQMGGVIGFLTATNLDSALRAKKWENVARRYNGKNYAKKGYHTKLHDAFVDYSVNGTPDMRIRTAQVYLTYGGFKPGPVDGAIGNRTRTALKAFQQAKSLPVTGEVDAPTYAALTA